jgi:hypothetical protein
MHKFLEFIASIFGEIVMSKCHSKVIMHGNGSQRNKHGVINMMLITANLQLKFQKAAC